MQSFLHQKQQVTHPAPQVLLLETSGSFQVQRSQVLPWYLDYLDFQLEAMAEMIFVQQQ
jgi:hypothetical protein